MLKKISLLSLCLTLTACNVSERLERVGKAPDFNDINTFDDEVITGQIAKHKSSKENAMHQANASKSLWKPGTRSFFRDQRARSIGDILKVQVMIQDSAKLDNKTETKRNESTDTGVPALLGYEASFNKILPQAVNPSSLLRTNTNDINKGEAKVDRKETINTTVAATVIEILPSSNLVIKGSQEIKVNYEVREITIEGIVRPEDISTDNSVTLDQIAEARVTYGGRGQMSDYQQPRYGKQILDILSPF
jgi:flagellar L-ring protein FlgH